MKYTNKITAATIARTAALLLALANQILSAFGKSPLPIESSTVISIHALREEGDSKNRDKISIFKQIIQHSARI